MNVTKTDRGFEELRHSIYLPGTNADTRIASQSSAVGFDGEGNSLPPGSGHLWIGMHHHLSRRDVKQFVAHLENWLKTGKLDTGALAQKRNPPH